MLGCLANICNSQIALETLDLTMSLLSHSKPLIRKKAAAVIGKMFMLAPELIPNNLEKVIGKITTEDHSSKTTTKNNKNITNFLLSSTIKNQK